MVFDKRLASQTLLYGTVGGLVGLFVCAVFIWLLNTLWHPEMGVAVGMVWGLKIKSILIYYLPLGLLLGFAISLIEPLSDDSFKDAFTVYGKWLLLGTVFGGLGSVVGGFFGEWIFSQLDGLGQVGTNAMTILGRVIGSMVLGLCIGLGLGLVDRLRTHSNDRFKAGLIGGGLGGILSAITFQFFIVWPEAMPIVPIISLTLFAAGAIGTVTYLKTHALLVGHRDNSIFKYAAPTWNKKLLADAPNTIGSGIPGIRMPHVQIQIANDLHVMPEHAIIELNQQTKRWMLARWSMEAVDLYLNNRQLTGDSVPLSDGDLITFGGTSLRLILRKSDSDEK